MTESELETKLRLLNKMFIMEMIDIFYYREQRIKLAWDFLYS